MKIYEIPIYINVEGKDYIVFPERVSWNAIEEMKREHGSYNFSTQNLLDPIPEGDKKFDVNWIKYFDPVDIEKKTFYIIICVDPASTKNNYSDYTAMTVHGWDWEQNWYILDLYHDKYDKESDRARKLFELHRKWQPFSQVRIKVLYETLSFQITDKHYIERKMIEDDYRFEVVEMAGGKMHSTSKIERIKALQPYFENNLYETSKKIFIPRTAPHYIQFKKQLLDITQEFIYEFCFFTPCGTHLHDDLLDSCTFPLYWDGFKSVKGRQLKKPDVDTPYTVADLERDMNSKWSKAAQQAPDIIF